MTDIRKDIYQESRPWGNFRRFTLNSPSTVKIIEVLPGQSLSLQTHTARGEFWRILSGTGTVEIDEKPIRAKKGDEFFIETGMKHRAFTETDTLEILEIAVGEFDENDITRFEDKYGRTK
ncbi:MAG: phosphomannose isomerase type II C-terminal cupin domain [Patescibacteria group bacterium]